jgi:hypothetical protein
MDTQQSQTGKNFKTDSKRAAVELCRAGVALATIRKQLKMSESTLRRILLGWLQRTAETDFLHNLVESMPARIQEVIDRDGGMTKY